MQAIQEQTVGLLALVPNLRRYARALTGESSLADELVRDTLEHACCLSAFTSCGRNPRPCLLGILHRRFTASAGLRSGASIRHASVADAALQSLPDEERAILLLAVLERMTCAEVACVTGYSVASVTAFLAAARDKLRTHIDTPAPAPLP